jgi:hypothetical protein
MRFELKSLGQKDARNTMSFGDVYNKLSISQNTSYLQMCYISINVDWKVLQAKTMTGNNIH